MLTRKLLPAAALLLLASSAFAEPPQTTHYVGTINADLNISLSLTASSNDTKIAGTYLYAQYAHDISLAGTGKADTLSLTESSDDGKAKGTFKLNPTAQAKPGSFDTTPTPLAGTWTDGKKSLPVSLTPVAKTITLISSRSDRYDATTHYLQFLGTSPFAKALTTRLETDAFNQHNQRVKDLAAETTEAATSEFPGPLPWENLVIPQLFCATDRLVSIRYQSYSYTGGAHGNTANSAENFAWLNNQLVALTTADLITPASLPTLRDLCIKDLKTQKASWPDQITWDKTHTPTLNLTPSALVITFDPYEVSSYDNGIYTVVLPWEKVKTLIPQASPLRELFPKQLAIAN